MTGHHLRRAHSRPDVYLHPAAHRDMGELPRQLRKSLHLVAVPLTGNRRVAAAILLDADPAELLRIRKVLSDVSLFVVTTAPATQELIAASEMTGTRLLPEASAEQVRNAVLRSMNAGGIRTAA